MKYFTLVSCMLLFSCSQIMDFEDDTMAANMESEPSDVIVSQDETLEEVNVEPVASQTIDDYYRKPITKNVNHYAKWIAQDLFGNIDFPSNQDVFVVADFALLDSNMNETNHFGRQLTEALMHEVNRTGFSVIDTKATGFIRISETGDVFFHSEDYTELSQKVAATNIIAGTLTKHQGGYLVNARIISMESMAMVSSAQAFVPHEVVEAVLLETKADTAMVSEDETKESTTDKKIVKPSGIPLKAYQKASKS